jgi:hypothetical protein
MIFKSFIKTKHSKNFIGSVCIWIVEFVLSIMMYLNYEKWQGCNVKNDSFLNNVNISYYKSLKNFGRH